MKQSLIAFDQLVNTVFGGYADETLSARAWRLRKVSYVWRTARVIIDSLFFWDKNHCQMSYLSELERNQLPKEYIHKQSTTH